MPLSVGKLPEALVGLLKQVLVAVHLIIHALVGAGGALTGRKNYGGAGSQNTSYASTFPLYPPPGRGCVQQFHLVVKFIIIIFLFLFDPL